MFISFFDSVPGDSLGFHQENQGSLSLIGNSDLLCMQCRGIEPHFPARGMSHTFSRVAPRTCGIYASYSGDGHSKLHFVQRSQESCVVMRDTSGI